MRTSTGSCASALMIIGIGVALAGLFALGMRREVADEHPAAAVSSGRRLR